ncbi:uncharacterized protein LOC143559446 [Bidens hawaiensis]|uniref:uncharacterized protein LOC143559446 n=1 Tax=Bidens hawaiensis TaxID=980011 RepID=UPI00404B58A4
MRLGFDSAPKSSDAKTKIEDIYAGASTIEEGANLEQIIVGGSDIVQTGTETINEDRQNSGNEKRYISYLKRTLCKYTIKGDWSKAEPMLKDYTDLQTNAISSDGSTMLHIAVGMGHNDFVKKSLSYINDEQVLIHTDYDGSTALHIAAIAGNKYAADLLVKKNSKLLHIKDFNGQEPLQKAYENMHLDTITYLLKAIKDDDTLSQSSLAGSVHLDDEIGVRLVVNAISAKQYSVASELVQSFPRFASKRDDVLMALAQNFPSGLDYWETLVYPSLENILAKLLVVALITVMLPGCPIHFRHEMQYFSERKCWRMLAILLLIVPSMLASVLSLTCLLMLIVCYICALLYLTWWKGTQILAFGPIRHIENKKKEWDEAKKLLELICDKIDELNYSGTHHPHYTRPILEAASHNAYKVVDEILFRSPEAIQSKDKSGYDIIQLAIEIVLKKSTTLSMRLRTGAALQLQRELQWREEVKKLVFPTYITEENILKETPDMVFTKEHKDLVKEGEQWMKTTAASCSITAALITTTVFAAAITVPGGSHQEKGIPLFGKKSAFIVFAISDAISLFASSTALLVFLSILTARFAEKDFLVSLPRRLFIGLFSLLLSTTAMMVAFSATLFLVFCHEKRWMLAPICGLALIPIAFFVGLQFPLMVDLFRSTYLRIFGKQRSGFLRRFNPDDIRLRFGK